MRRVAIDETVLLRWFVDDGHPGVRAARALRRAYEGGDLLVVVAPDWEPDLLDAVAGRLEPEKLASFAEAVRGIGLEVRRPQAATVARWMARGLSAREAAAVAVADEGDLRLISANPRLVGIAAPVLDRLR
jgi:hypothetical protein